MPYVVKKVGTQWGVYKKKGKKKLVGKSKSKKKAKSAIRAIYANKK